MDEVQVDIFVETSDQIQSKPIEILDRVDGIQNNIVGEKSDEKILNTLKFTIPMLQIQM